MDASAGRTGVALSLHQNVEHFAFIVDGAPEIHALATDGDDHLVQVPA